MPKCRCRSLPEFVPRRAVRMHAAVVAVEVSGDGREALLLYDLVWLSGAAMRIADYYTVSNGKI
jgi:hypothetical protein